MMNPDPELRVSAKEALQDDWFSIDLEAELLSKLALEQHSFGLLSNVTKKN